MLPSCAVSRKDRDERRAVRSVLRQLAKEERKRQEKAVEEVLRGAQVSAACLRLVSLQEAGTTAQHEHNIKQGSPRLL